MRASIWGPAAVDDDGVDAGGAQARHVPGKDARSSAYPIAEPPYLITTVRPRHRLR